MEKCNRQQFKIFYSSTIAAVTISCGLIGCNGQIYTIYNPKGVEVPEKVSLATVNEEKKCDLSSIANDKMKPCKFEGVLAYRPANFIEISWTTSVLKTVVNAKDGKPEKTTEVERTYKGTNEATKCEPQMVIKQVVRGDYERPYQLFYAPGLLEKYTFKAEFEQGVLKSINADSTPDRGETLKNLVTAASEAAKIAAGAMALEGNKNGAHQCTDGLVLTHIKRAEEVCFNGVCDYTNYTFPK